MVHMGCDSCASTEDQKIVFDGCKLFEKEGFLFGYAGSYRFPDIVEYHTKFPKRGPKDDDRGYLVSKLLPAIRDSLKAYEFIRQDEVLDQQALIGYRGKLYQLSSDFSVIRAAHGYAAIGSGMSVALGSLHSTVWLNSLSTKDRITFAINAAGDHARGVGGPTHYRVLQ
jgi:ATP-dependent protease HslVU (ClpYQ) peptidase subunit